MLREQIPEQNRSQKHCIMTILIIGNCGSGKTWVMRQLIEQHKANKRYKLGLVSYASNGSVNIIGKYDGSMFEGSDKLSMAVISDIRDYASYARGKITIAEGDRFSNNRFITETGAKVIRITDDGKAGREKRGSKQTDRHLKAISTRVSNIASDYDVKSSQECLELINQLINKHENNRD